MLYWHLDAPIDTFNVPLPESSYNYCVAQWWAAYRRYDVELMAFWNRVLTEEIGMEAEWLSSLS